MSGWISDLKAFFGFGPESEKRSVSPRPPKRRAKPDETGQDSHRTSAQERKALGKRVDYLLVVGLDFGTAYTKCVVRDANVRDPGKAYPVHFGSGTKSTYLFPSVVHCEGTNWYTAFDEIPPCARKVDYLKMRLVAEADGSRAEHWRNSEIQAPMQAVVAWFLAQVLVEVGRFMKDLWADFGDNAGDLCFVNLCVPIAHCEQPLVERALLNALCAARAAVGPLGAAAPDMDRIKAVLASTEEVEAAKQFCYTYPETSANIQAFLKSRSRKPGLYLLLDVGAGTVDLSFFQLLDAGRDDPLRYYHSSVLEAGSSRLELLALRHDPTLVVQEVIAVKEGLVSKGSQRIMRALTLACEQLHDEVARGVGDGVKVTWSKLHIDRKEQLKAMSKVRLMFSGGGFRPTPYEEAVRFFQRASQWEHSAPIEPIPLPDDLHWRGKVPAVDFKRVAVAYGLSFARYDLDDHRFPGAVTVNPKLAPKTPSERTEAPTKDDV